MKIVIGIPAYNEEKKIASIILKLKTISQNIIVCDDGSNDLTADIANELGAIVVKHEKNFVIWTTPVFSISFIAFALLFERTSLFVTTFVGISLLVPTIFVIASEIIKKFSNEKVKLRNTAVFLISLIIGIISSLIVTYIVLKFFINITSEKYLGLNK